jgi:putative N-acetylmannosamine-6-phosphate epimerase
MRCVIDDLFEYFDRRKHAAMRNRSTIQEQMKGKLVVSCQADPGNALENTDAIRRMARAVV